MCKRNSPDENKPSMGCVRETPHIKKEKKEKRGKKVTTTNKKSMGCVRKTLS